MLLDKITAKFQLRLKDRNSAGNILGEALKDVIKNDKELRDHTIVLGIPRGGVIVADVIVKKLGCKLDIVNPRKLRAPHNEEIAIGALMEDGTTYLNGDLVRELDISKDYIEKEKTIQIQEIRRRSLLYRNPSTSTIVDNQQNLNESYDNIILVDDGAATGATIIVAARWIRKNIPHKNLIIAVPVVPKIIKELLEKEADRLEAITTPSISNFKSVGQYYQSFEPTPEEQVIEIMTKY